MKGSETMYDEKAKARNIRSLQKNFEQVRLTVKKGKLAKYKAFAEKQGMSMTAFITALVEAEIAKDAEFCSAWQDKIESEQAEQDATKQAKIDRIKSENASAMLDGMKRGG
jgi:hypothetical protein